MIFHKTAIAAILTTGLAGVSSQAFAHSYYNLTGAGTVASGNSAIGFGIANSINGTDGVSANSNGTNRIANGTNVYTVGDLNANTLIPGTGTAAETATEVAGNLPYMWYSGQHTTAAGFTKRELHTGSSATDNDGALTANLINSNPSFGTNTIGSLWKAYSDKNGGTNAATWGTIMADLPANGDHPYLAVAGNSASTGLGLDYGLIHISCGANTASANCASAGNIKTTITVKNDADYSQFNGLLDVALYRNVDSSSTSDRNAAATIGETGLQGSSLGEAIWTASMNSTSDTLFYSFVFDQAEWNATGTPGLHTNGFYTLVVGAHGGGALDGVTYDVLVTTSAVPVPGAVWLFSSAMAGLIGFGRRKQQLAA